MVRRTVTGTTSFTDFLELIQENQKADLLDGVIYMASPESLDHNDLVFWLGSILRLYVEERRLGRMTVNKVAFRLSHHSAPEPDLAFVKSSRFDRLKSGYVDGPPDLAVEIVSPDSIERDYENKRRRYEEAGVGEYWIIDPLDSSATFLVREGSAFVERSPKDHIYRSDVLAGFEFDVRWLWQRPLPPTLPIVRGLLGH